jgi:hypothetical protein
VPHGPLEPTSPAVRHHRTVPDDQPAPTTESCPGCGAVLVPLTSGGPSHPGASASCARVFEVTLPGPPGRGGAHPATAVVLALADAAYEAQHPVRGEEGRLHRALEQLGVPLGAAAGPETERTPRAWRTTIADVAADLDVIDLSVLVESWARAVHEDWSGDPAIGK